MRVSPDGREAEARLKIIWVMAGAAANRHLYPNPNIRDQLRLRAHENRRG
jgi:hypothetical protein